MRKYNLQQVKIIEVECFYCHLDIVKRSEERIGDGIQNMTQIGFKHLLSVEAIRQELGKAASAGLYGSINLVLGM